MDALILVDRIDSARKAVLVGENSGVIIKALETRGSIGQQFPEQLADSARTWLRSVEE